MQKLYNRLMKDIRDIGIKEEFKLVLKPYSKSYYGTYNPNSNTITLYVYSDKGCTKVFPYLNLLLTLVHEAIHCKQWKRKDYRRVKGIMHDEEFKILYNVYSDRARAILLMREVMYIEKSTISMGK